MELHLIKNRDSIWIKLAGATLSFLRKRYFYSFAIVPINSKLTERGIHELWYTSLGHRERCYDHRLR